MSELYMYRRSFGPPFDQQLSFISLQHRQGRQKIIYAEGDARAEILAEFSAVSHNIVAFQMRRDEDSRGTKMERVRQANLHQKAIKHAIAHTLEDEATRRHQYVVFAQRCWSTMLRLERLAWVEILHAKERQQVEWSESHRRRYVCGLESEAWSELCADPDFRSVQPLLQQFGECPFEVVQDCPFSKSNGCHGRMIHPEHFERHPSRLRSQR